MELILWRHAEAEDGIPDLERRLTAKGEKQADKMAAFLRARLPRDTNILVSPAQRAQQTAQAFSQNFTTEPTLAPGATPQAVLEAAGWIEGDGCTLIVGHQPSLGEVASLIMAGTVEYWSIKKGAVWWFSRREHESNMGVILRLVIAPDQL